MIQHTPTRITKGCCWLGLLLGLSITSSVYAQKIVSFDARMAIFSTQQAQVHSQKLQQQLKPQIDRIQKLEVSIQKLQARYEADQLLLSEAEVARLQEDLQTQVTEARKLQQYIANSKATAEREFEKVLFPLLDKVVEDYVKANGITMIINSEAVIYVNKAHNITPDVIRLLDQQ